MYAVEASHLALDAGILIAKPGTVFPGSISAKN